MAQAPGDCYTRGMNLLRKLLMPDAPAKAAQPVPPDRRRSPRYQVMQPASIFITHRPLTASLVDINRHGARISCRFPQDVGTILGLQVEVDGEARLLPLKLLWERFAEGSYQFGGEFVLLTEEELHHLDRFLEAVAENQGALTQRIA
jgi:hypothetical protein